MSSYLSFFLGLIQQQQQKIYESDVVVVRAVACFLCVKLEFCRLVFCGYIFPVPVCTSLPWSLVHCVASLLYTYEWPHGWMTGFVV